MTIVGLSGNMCTDKKPSAVNWSVLSAGVFFRQQLLISALCTILSCQYRSCVHTVEWRQLTFVWLNQFVLVSGVNVLHSRLTVDFYMFPWYCLFPAIVAK